MTDAAAVAARWGTELLDLLFPSRCIACRRTGVSLCPDCRATISFIRPPLCARCGSPASAAVASCHVCRSHPPRLERLRSVAYHEGVVREAIHGLKYQGRVDLVAPLAGLLVEHFKLSSIEADVIAAVPLAPARERERGYNQAELLARALAASTGHPYVQGLVRTRETADQVGKNAAERHANVRGAFRADAGAFAKKRVLLIDDVCTTGATLDACAVALQAQGVQKVYGLTVARPRERVD